MEQAQLDTHERVREKDTYFLAGDFWTKVRNSLALLALLGWGAAAAGFAANRAQFHFSYLVAFLFCVSITLGALFYVMLQHLTGSAWSVTVRRLMETMVRTIPLALLLFIPVYLGVHTTHEWGHPEAAQDPILSRKAGYLNDTWWLVRGYLVMGLWSLLAWLLYRNSRRQDENGSLKFTQWSHNLSAPGVIVLFVSAALAAFDWIMSLDPHWWSTMYGVYFLAGGAVGFMAALIAVCLALRSAGYLTNSINREHYHDLGKWLFALTVFWAYISFSQYMLIWYGNLPEENIWFHKRLQGTWYWWRPLLIAGHFGIPFFALMARGSKRNLKLLGFFAGWMLVFHYVDLYWQVMPTLHRTGFQPSWIDIACLVAVASSYGLAFWSGLKEKPLVPLGDPRLEQCLAFQNA